MSEYLSKYNKTIKQTWEEASSQYDDVKEAWDKIYITPDKTDLGLDATFEFSIRKSESIRLQSTISDYVSEGNENIQSNITLQPLEFTITGSIGENVIKAPRLSKVSKVLQERLNPLALFNANMTTQAQQYLNKFNDVLENIDNVIDKVGSAFDYVNNFTKNIELNQNKTFLMLMTLWKSRSLLTVKSDFYTANNMAIQSIDFTQGEETRDKSECSITLKQMTFTTIKTKRVSGTMAKKLNDTKKGKTEGKDASILTRTINQIKSNLKGA